MDSVKGLAKRTANIGQYDPIFEQDKWIISDLRIGYDVPDYVRIKSISFDGIEPPAMKRAVKQYAYFMLSIDSAVSTVSNYLRCLTYFAAFLGDEKGRRSFSELSRDDVREFVKRLDDRGVSKEYVNLHLNAIKSLVDYGTLLDLDGMPDKRSIVDHNLRRRTDTSFTDPYSQGEIDRLFEHAAEIHLPVRRMLIVAANAFVRFSELSTLKASQLVRNPDGTYSLDLRLYKAKSRHTVPIPDEVALVIEDAIEYSRQIDPDTPYVFLNENSRKGNPIRANTFVNEIEKVIRLHEIKNDEGELLHIRSHRFRAYLATKYINLGYDVEHVRMLMGHKSSAALWHYAQIHSKFAWETMSPVIENRAWHIDNMGRVFETRRIEAENAMLLPLSNGACAKPLEQGRCDHANRCYSCTFFVPRKEDLPKYERQLEFARANLRIAQTENLTRQIEHNAALVMQLESIIGSLTLS